MFSFIRKPYFIAFIVIYLGSLFLLYKSGYPTVHILVSLFCFALVLPLIAYVVSVKTRKAVNSQPFFYREWLSLAGLTIYMLIYITWGAAFISRALLPVISTDPLALFVLETIKEVIFYFVLPFVFYLVVYGFSLREAGLRIPGSQIFSWLNILTFVVLSGAIILSQYLLDEKLEWLWEGEYPARILLLAIPLLFFLLCFKTGLAYGFFYRALMQSRLSIGLNSKFGGMVISLLLFGLLHVPAMLHRGVADRHETAQFPGAAMVFGISIGNLAISALFIAIVWRRSKNLWLVMGLYAMLELLPNLKQFMTLLM